MTRLYFACLATTSSTFVVIAFCPSGVPKPVKTSVSTWLPPVTVTPSSRSLPKVMLSDNSVVLPQASATTDT
jgi:hypothetical protein